MNGFLILVATLLTVVGLIVGAGVKKIDEGKTSCEARGGVQVRTYEGYACIKAEVLK